MLRSPITSAVAVLAAVLLVVLAAGPGGAAQLTTAKAVEVTPPVLVSQDGDHASISQGDMLKAGQTLETGKGGRVALLLPDGSRIDVFEETTIEMNELLPEEESTSSFSLFFGHITVIANEMSGDDVVIAPNLTAGIRGTKFSVSVAEDGSSVVTVDEGQVEVATDEEGTTASSVKVFPGQEVQADRAGVPLYLRPSLLRTYEDWQNFRDERRQVLAEQLPAIVAALEESIDPELEKLEWLQAVPLDRQKVLEELEKRLADVDPADAATRARLIIETHVEMAKSLTLAKQFRVQRMRVRSIFVQSRHLQTLSASMQGASGKSDPGLAKTSAALERIMDRRGEVSAKEQELTRKFRESMQPVRSIYQKFDQDLGGVNVKGLGGGLDGGLSGGQNGGKK